MEPPKPDFAIPYKIMAGITVKKNNKFISIIFDKFNNFDSSNLGAIE